MMMYSEKDLLKKACKTNCDSSKDVSDKLLQKVMKTKAIEKAPSDLHKAIK